MLRPGDVVVQEGPFDWKGQAFKWACRSQWTHVFLVLNEETLIESEFPMGVRIYPLQKRLEELREQRRSYVVMSAPDLLPDQRKALAKGSKFYLGRLYDPLQALIWFFTHRFWRDGDKRMVCSRFVAAAYSKYGYHLFDHDIRGVSGAHLDNLRHNYALPCDILLHSRLRVKTVWTPTLRWPRR